MNDVWRYRDSAWSEGDEVVGYDVQATDGSIGTIDGATADTDAAHIVVDTGFWIFGKRRLIPAGLVTAVDHDARTVAVSLSKDQVQAGPDYDDADWDERSRTRHMEYYGPFA
jgi:hypothetical protein